MLVERVIYFRYVGRMPAVQRIDIGDKPTAEHSTELVAELIAAFEQGTLASVDLVYSRFVSAISTPSTMLGIVPHPRRGAQTA